VVEQLKSIDQEVRSHEMAHIVAGGRYVTSGARLDYRRGPDGKSYAVAGEVSIDTSAVPGDPQATAEKMRTVQRAALAPAAPSAQDRKVAARAASAAAKAMAELMLMQSEARIREVSGSDQTGSGRIDAYSGAGVTGEAKGNVIDVTA
jgi:hypothetical protein